MGKLCLAGIQHGLPSDLKTTWSFNRQRQVYTRPDGTAIQGELDVSTLATKQNLAPNML